MNGSTSNLNPTTTESTNSQNLTPITQIADGLLALIHDYAKEEGSPEGKEFCSRVLDFRRQLDEPDGITQDNSKECLDVCTEYFHRINALGNRREAEFSELIELLKEALTQGATETEVFHERIFDTSDKFKRLSQLEDIREIKKELVNLVRDLRQVVLEKQQTDEQRKRGLSKRVEMLETKLEAARRQALTDPLTRVANRGGFDQVLRSWINQDKQFVVGLVDLDHFKSINDTHGHRVGDSVLVCAAQWVGERIRSKDLLARYGGDEFAVLLDGLSLAVAQQKFSALLIELSDRSYVYTLGGQKHTVKFTLSCGLTEFAAGDTGATLVQRADEALYDAKKQRNQVCSKRRSLFGGDIRKPRG